MTEIECLEKMVKVWRYLEKHPEVRNKEEAYSALNLPYELHYCPCCAYVRQQGHGFYCKLCPLISFWSGNKGRSNIFCEATGSQYSRWKSTDLEVRAAAAKEIADYSEQLLNKLKGGKAKND